MFIKREAPLESRFPWAMRAILSSVVPGISDISLEIECEGARTLEPTDPTFGFKEIEIPAWC